MIVENSFSLDNAFIVNASTDVSMLTHANKRLVITWFKIRIDKNNL